MGGSTQDSVYVGTECNVSRLGGDRRRGRRKGRGWQVKGDSEEVAPRELCQRVCNQGVCVVTQKVTESKNVGSGRN